ncbi:MAG: hypothetical protein ACI965_002303 [Paraglaciecola sp.]
MSEPVNQPSSFTDTQGSQSPGRVSDREFSGQINQATGQGAKFALLLAMLEQDLLHRPKLLASETAKNIHADTFTKASYYPSTPLKPDGQHWANANSPGENIAKNSIRSAHLWLLMHPQPLSLHNDANRLDDDIVANCDIHTQQRLQALSKPDIAVDETRLYDILQGMEAEIDTAA